MKNFVWMFPEKKTPDRAFLVNVSFIKIIEATDTQGWYSATGMDDGWIGYVPKHTVEMMVMVSDG